MIAGIDLTATTALSYVYLWVVFSYFSGMIGCDIQNLLTNNLVVRHIVGLITFFFLFTSIDKNSEHQHVAYLWIKALILYIVFLMASKTTWHFSAPILILLVADLCIKTQENYYSHNNIYYDSDLYNNIHRLIYIAIVILSLIGMIVYGSKEKTRQGNAFSIIKFIFDNNCHNNF